MDVVDEEKDSCGNCHRRDFSVDPRYKLTFTVVSNEEIRTCKLAKVKPQQVRKYHPILEGDNVGDVGTWRFNHKGPNVNANEWLFCD
jgi:hypothetical protein